MDLLVETVGIPSVNHGLAPGYLKSYLHDTSADKEDSYCMPPVTKH